MRRNYILNIFIKNYSEKTEDMIYIIYLEYPYKNPGGENQRYDIKYCLIKTTYIYEKNLNKKTHLGKEYNYIIW